MNGRLTPDDLCTMCNGPLTAEPTMSLVETDIPMPEDECPFVADDNDPTRCERDGWARYEHEEDSYTVHGSCYLDKDDEVSLVSDVRR